MSGGALSKVTDPLLRQAAFSVEQMAPGGVERPECGTVRDADLSRARARLQNLLERGTAQREAVQVLLQRTDLLARILARDGTDGIAYLEDAELGLQPRLRAAAIEIDFSFGDQDGRVSDGDLRQARHHYGKVRGPVGWNRLLVTDEVERRLYPERALKSTDGLRLLPSDWLTGPPDALSRLRKVCRYLDDHALARTYADIAARLATVATVAPGSELAQVFEEALSLLGREIRGRDSVRPTLTDIARIGCEDPEVKAWLKTPIEMSRRLHPSSLLDRYLS